MILAMTMAMMAVLGGSSDEDGCDNGCSDGGNCDDDVGRCACGRGAPMEFVITTMVTMA